MALDIRDFRRSQETRASEKVANRTTAGRILTQAAVEIDKLTGDPLWDKLLTILQPELENAVAQRDAAIQKMLSMEALKDESIHRLCVVSFWTNQARVEVFEHIINLPKQLVEDAKLVTT